MEWLEFDSWAAEVGRKLAAKIDALHLPQKKPVLSKTSAQQREQLAALLRSSEPTNPWGH